MAAASGIAVELLEFLNAAPTPFHAVEEAKQRLSKAGFVQISERHPWNIEAGGKYFFTRNHSTIIAFAIGNKCASNPCLLLFFLVTSHTHIHVLAKLPEPQLVQYLFGCKSFAWVLGFRVA
jgi:aspartyl aminopeptidase